MSSWGTYERVKVNKDAKNMHPAVLWDYIYFATSWKSKVANVIKRLKGKPENIQVLNEFVCCSFSVHEGSQYYDGRCI